MDTAWLLPVAPVAGAVVGAGLALLGTAAVRRSRAATAAAHHHLPEGVSLVLDALHAPAAVVDASNNVVKASPSAVISGLVQGRDLVQPAVIGVLDQCRARLQPLSVPVQLQRGRFGEESAPVVVHVSAVDARLHLVVVEDESEAMRLAEVRRDFVLNVSHELKTPVAAVQLLSEALLDAADDGEAVRHFAARLNDESVRLGTLIQEMIELSRLQAGDPLERAEQVRIADIVATVLARTAGIAEGRQISVVPAKKLKGKVYGDRELLITALENLVVNAIQHSPEGSRVAIASRKEDGQVQIQVIDQGPGIPEAELERIFERFYRLDDARSRGTGGSGLGLSIVKHIITNHGGSVQAWSRPGQGATFTVRLPDLTATATGVIEVVQ